MRSKKRSNASWDEYRRPPIKTVSSLLRRAPRRRQRELSSEGLEENRKFLAWANDYANSIDPFRDILKRPIKDISLGSEDAPKF